MILMMTIQLLKVRKFYYHKKLSAIIQNLLYRFQIGSEIVAQSNKNSDKVRQFKKSYLDFNFIEVIKKHTNRFTIKIAILLYLLYNQINDFFGGSLIE